MSISMALFSPPTHPPSISPSSSPKPHFTLKPHLSLRPPKAPFFLLSTTRASVDNGAGISASAATALEPEAGQKVVEKDESSAGANGSAGAAEAVEVKVVSKFEDRRWVGGTWDLKQFEKDGKPDWDAVIDAGRAAMIGFFMAYLVDSLTGVGLVDQMGNFFCKTLLFVAVVGVLVIRKNEDIENLKKLLEETTFYDKQWQATWQDETRGGSKNQ